LRAVAHRFSVGLHPTHTTVHTTEAAVTTPIRSRERDAAAIPLWNDQYHTTQLGEHPNLWGDPPVPYAHTAAQLLKTHHANTILDLPCGDGRNLPPLATSAPILLAGDTSPNAMRIAEHLTTRTGIRHQVIFLTLDATNTGLLDNSIDGIFCWDLLGHLTHPEDALRELHRITRPGGHIIANMWTMNDCQVFDPHIKEIAPKEYVDHFDFYCRHYDPEDLHQLLNSINLTPTTIETKRWTEPPHAGYRDYQHEHESLIFTIQKNPT
jgi:ubiquinone/menaquinone biosynthesis C-methylase UbiE